MASRIRLAVAAATFLSLTAPGSAQLQSNDTLSDCPLPGRHVANDRLYNATGTVAIPSDDDDPWYVSTTITDLRSPRVYYDGARSAQDLGIFLSVPESVIGSESGNETRICTYTMRGQNATSEGDGSAEESCKGVLSDECIDAYLQATIPPEDGPCPELDVSDRCDVETGFRLITPLTLNSSSCTLDELPQSDIPSGYRTYSGFPGGHIQPPDMELDEFDVYDLRVRQPVPLLFTVRSGTVARAHLVCVAPSNIVEGSREPEGEFPPSAAAGLRSGFGVAVMVAVVASAVIM